MSTTFQTPQEILAYVGKMLFERRLTDFCGGNISMRVDDVMYITPRHSGAKQHWDVDPATIVWGDIHSNDILNQPGFSREGKAHLGMYRTYPEVHGIVHSHPFYVLPFCAGEKPIPPVLEATEKFETIEFVPFGPAHSQELADNIVRGFSGKTEMIIKQAAAVLLPKHGLFVAGKDIHSALDATERINWNAWCILAQRMMPEVL